MVKVSIDTIKGEGLIQDPEEPSVRIMTDQEHIGGKWIPAEYLRIGRYHEVNN